MLNHAKMIITCPECATRYQIYASGFPDEGREVKCTSCSHKWFQDYESLVPADMPEEASPASKKPDFAKPAPQEMPKEAEGAEEGGEKEETTPQKTPASIEQEASRLLKHSKIFHSRNKEEKTERNSKAKKILLLFSCLVIIGALGVKHRVGIVKKLPETAFIYKMMGLPVNVRGLEFKNIEAVRDFQNGIPVLSITGEIKNVSKTTRKTAALRYALYNARAQEVYHWFVPMQVKNLGPNTSLPIAARLAAPPSDARKLEVRFVRNGK